MNGRSSDDLGSPRLVFPKWRIAREASIAELCLAFVDRCRSENLSPSTQRYYRQTSDRWLRFCEEQQLTDPREVSPDHLTAYAGWLQAGGNNKQSVATWLRGVRALLSWAELRGFIELSPFRLWKLKQPKLPAQRGFGAAEVRRMVDLAGQQLANPLRDTAIILLLFDTGIRRSETCRVHLNDVIEGDHMASSVTVRGKGDKYRRIELHPQTQRAIFEYLVNERPQKERAEALFLGRGAHGVRGYHPLTVDGVSQIVERIARRAGLEGNRLGPHSLRHGFTHEYLESDGARIDDLQVLLGHESIAMSLHYAGQAAATARPRRQAVFTGSEAQSSIGQATPARSPKEGIAWGHVRPSMGRCNGLIGHVRAPAQGSRARRRVNW